MRVAIVAPHFPEYTLRYAAALSQRCDVLVCVDAGQRQEEYAGRDLPASTAKVFQSRFKTLLDLLRIFREVRAFRPTIVHFQEAAGPRRAIFNAIVAASMRHSASIVLTVHDPLPHEGRDRAVSRRMASVRHYLRRTADIVIVHGAYCERRLAETTPDVHGRVVRSEHGLILEPSLHADLPPPMPLKLYFFGRMEAYKGIDTMLAMAEQLHEEGFAFSLSIAGRGSELDRLEQRFERLPEVSLHNGFAPPNDVIAAIQACHCVLLPYRSATQSGVLAAAFGGWRFVIASQTGGIGDLVVNGQNGLLVPPDDPQALADAVRSVGQDTLLRRRLGDGARATAETQLDWNRIAADLHAVYEQCNRPAGRSPARETLNNLKKRGT